jgi:hypothetical protein
MKVVLVAVVAVAALATGCGKSSSSIAELPPSTTNPAPATAAFVRGVRNVIEPSGHPTAIAIPATFVSCIASHLDAAARARVTAVTNADKVPGDSESYVAHAANLCNRGLLLSSLVRGLQMSGIPMSAPQASCASRKALAGLLLLNPATVGRNPDANAAERVLIASLDGCVSYFAFIDSSLRQGAPSITPSAVACINTKLRIRSFAQMASAGHAAFDAAGRAAVAACRPH